MQITLLSYLILLHLLLHLLPTTSLTAQRCRFAHNYTPDQILKTPDSFLQQYITWQTKFIREIGVQSSTGLTYDGYRIDINTGDLLKGGLHYWTASSKQSLHVGLFANILYSGRQDIYTYTEIFDILKKKIQTYQQFHQQFPGFGGFLPWLLQNGSYPIPTPDFQSRIPSLDNGQLFWSALALSYIWKYKHESILPIWRDRWDDITWKLMIKNAKNIFYNSTTGKIRAVAQIRNTSAQVQNNTYWNNDNYYLDDPYEGQLFTWISTLFPKQTGFSQTEIDHIWQDKRNKLKSVNYNSLGAKTNITVEKGWWFSSHQQWKNLFLPYSDSKIYKKIQYNNEKARTWYSYDQRLCGMYASVTGPAKTNTQNMQYYSDCGIPQLSFQPITHTHMITPYSVFPLFLVSKNHAAVWLHNMLTSPSAQTIYGSLQATSIDGKDISPVVTWDSKITNVLAIMGGNKDIVRDFMIKNNIYEQFINRIQAQYSREFTKIDGQSADFALPRVTVHRGRPDFPNCKT